MWPRMSNEIGDGARTGFSSLGVGGPDLVAKFDPIDGGVRMNVSYEVRRSLVGNLDIVGHFENSQDLTSHGE